MQIKKIMTFLTVLTVLTICSCSRPMHERFVTSFSCELAADNSESLRNEPKSDKVETTERKIIKQGDIRFKTADVNKTKTLIQQTVQELNGYLSNDNAYDYSDRFEHKLTIRVPADKFDLLLNNISESVVKLDRKKIDVLDVTEEFIDMEARIKTKKELHGRYTELLKLATKVEEILSIEKESGNLQSEIESVEGRMRYLKDKIAYSTLTVAYYQETTFEFGFPSKFTDGIINGWNMFLWFIIGLSHLWVFLLMMVVSVCLIRWRRKKENA